MGFTSERLILAPLELPPAKYADRTRHMQFLDDVVTRNREFAPASQP